MTNSKHIPEDSFMENFGMFIPDKPDVIPDLVEDPRGAPIYKGCGGGPCACTGRCKEIVGWSQDPEKLAAHREYIRQTNDLNKNGLFHLYRGQTTEENGIKIWKFKSKDNE